MHDPSSVPATSRPMLWTGRVLTALAGLSLLFDGVIKLQPLPIVTDTLVQLGYPASASLARGIGVVTLASTALYLWPRTAVRGAILLTALFGGAIATHLRVGSPIPSHLLFGVYLGLLVWGGLYLRNAHLRALLPWRRSG